MSAMIAMIKRNRRVGIAALILIAMPVAILGWWLGSPLFIDKTVDEEFPFAFRAVVPDDMSMAEAEATMSTLARSDDDPVREEMMDSADNEPAPKAIKRGEFRDADSFHKGSGTATVWHLGRDGFVLRLDDFRVTNGPDLRVILAKHADPEGRSDVHDDGYFELAELKGNIGNQNYEIPLDVDIEQYGSVVIYCKPFQVIFAVAPLSAPSAMPSS